MPESTHGSLYTEPSDEPWPLVNARPSSFFKAPPCPDLDELDSDVAFLGVPFDQGTLGQPGARFGLNSISDAPKADVYSDPLGAQWEAEGIFDLDVGDELLRGVIMADRGDVTVVP